MKKKCSSYHAVNDIPLLTRQLTMEGWSLEAEDANEDQKLASTDAGSSLARETTETPCRFDVLLGRGRKHNGHPGNARLQTVLNMHSVRYNAATSRNEKTAIIQEIVQSIQANGEPAGRFLKFEKDTNGWVEVDDAVARIKVGHAIRYVSKYKKRKVPPANLEPSSQDEANRMGSDTSRRRDAHQQERPRDRSPSLVFDDSILAGLGDDIIHFSSDTNDDDASVLYCRTEAIIAPTTMKERRDLSICTRDRFVGHPRTPI
jgi:hypothetical protein